jgi:hypothetical protein
MPVHRGARVAVLALLMLAAPVAAAAAPGAASAASPLVAQWHFDATDGIDSSGNHVNGQNGAGTQIVAGKFGSALQAGSTDPLLAVSGTSPRIGLLQPHAAGTVVLWFRQSGGPGNLSYLASDGGEGSPNCGGSAIGLYSGYGGGDDLRFYVRGTQGFRVTPSVGGGYYDGNWHMAAGTFDGTAAHLYVDGRLTGSDPVPGGGTDTIDYAPDTDASFEIGHYSTSDCGPTTFPGAIDEPRLYDRALTATEVARMAAATGPAPPDLVPDAPDGGTPTPPPGGGGTASGPPPAGGGTVAGAPGVGGTPPRIDGLSTRPGSAATGGVGVATAQVEGAAQLGWDVTGDGRPDVTCDASQASVGVKLGAPGGAAAASVRRAGALVSRTIGLTPISAGGVAAPQQTIRILTTAPVVTAGQRPFLRTVAMCAPEARETVFDGAEKAAILDRSCTNMTVASGIVEARGCLTHVTDPSLLPDTLKPVVQAYVDLGGNPKGPVDLFLSYQAVRVNGLVITPGGSTPVIVFPGIDKIVSANATVKFGVVRVSRGPLNLDVRPTTGADALGRSGSETLSSFDARRSLPSIGGFALDGQVTLRLVSDGSGHYSMLDIHVGVPDVFTAFGGRPPDATTSIRADDDHAPEIDDLDISVPHLELGPLTLEDVRFHYTAHGDAFFHCSGTFWKATARVFIGSDDGGEAGFILAPDPPQNGVEFCDGDFAGAGGDIQFGGPIPKPEIFPGVLVDQIGLQVQVHPPVVHGSVTLSVADLVSVRGDLLIALASPSEPYTLTTHDAASFGAVNNLKLVAPTVAVGGSVGVNVPLLDDPIALGSGYMLYEAPGYISAGGSVRLGFPGMTLDGSITGTVSVPTGQFDIEGEVTGCLVGIFCHSAAAWVSDVGIAICLGDIVHDSWVPGAGYRWGDILPHVWFPTGCKPSRFWDHNIRAPGTAARARGAQAGGAAPVTFRVVKGEDSKSVELQGRGGAPSVTLTGPDGEKVSIGPGGQAVVHGAHVGLLRDEMGSRTIAGVLGGRPGTYTITPAAGSAPIVEVQETRPDDGPSATVTGDGATRVLRYDAGLGGGGKKVTFFERGTAVFRSLKTSTGGRGAVTFTPARGPAGTREVVARTTLDGQPVPDLVVARFHASDSVSPGATRGVRARRSGRTLVVSWRPAVNAAAYGITVRTADGTFRLVRAGKARRSVRIAGVPAAYAGTVAVHAQGPLGPWGRAATARFGATARPRSAFGDYRALGRGTRKKAPRRR